MLRTILHFLLFAIFLTACGPLIPLAGPQATPQATSTGPLDLGQTWTIKMHQSGGIMGLSHSIEISSDGKYAITDDRANQSVKGQLTSAEMSQLRELITTANIKPIAKPGQSVCADCFIYALEINGAGKPFTIELNDITLPESGLESVVLFLRDLIDKSLK
jgi:hypothetical protein